MHLNKKAAIALAIVSLCLFTTEVLAQSSYGRDENLGSFNSLLLRFLMITTSISLGAFLGWSMSPNARQWYKPMLLVGGGVTFMIVVSSNGAFGWGVTLLASFIGFSVALGYWIGSGLKALGDVPTTFGSSRWANDDDLFEKNIYGDQGIILGAAPKDESSEIISYKGDRHLLTVAPTRSGKGTTQIIPNLLTYEGSMLVIDPKGENALITAKHRQEMGQEVHIVDPWGIARVDGIEPSTFNPLDWLQLSDIDITENAMLLADALVVGGTHNDSFWDEEAKALLQGLILFVAVDQSQDGIRHLGQIRNLLLLDGEEMAKMFKLMATSPHPIIASTGARSLQKEPKLMANVLASAQAQTHFLDSTRIQNNLQSSSFKFEDLKAKPMTIYLVLPADRLNAFGRWLRLLVQQAITVNARNIETKSEKPVLFILDEFAALGRLSMIEQAYGLMAGFGLQLWGIVQDFNQLERIYDKGWQSFISNSGMINYFGSSDRMTSEYFSAMCGETTVWNFSSAVSTAFGTTSGTSGSSSETATNSDTRAASQRKLIYPDELMRMKEGKQLVFIENMYPLMATKTKWFDDPKLKTLGVNLYADN